MVFCWCALICQLHLLQRFPRLSEDIICSASALESMLPEYNEALTQKKPTSSIQNITTTLCVLLCSPEWKANHLRNITKGRKLHMQCGMVVTLIPSVSWYEQWHNTCQKKQSYRKHLQYTYTFMVLMTRFLLTKAIHAQTCKACHIQWSTERWTNTSSTDKSLFPFSMWWQYILL